VSGSSWHEEQNAVLRTLLAEAHRKLTAVAADRFAYAQALEIIRAAHRPADVDARLCAEGCGGSWPCLARAEADAALAEAAERKDSRALVDVLADYEEDADGTA